MKGRVKEMRDEANNASQAPSSESIVGGTGVFLERKLGHRRSARCFWSFGGALRS